MISNKRILITGGGGFIGVALAERLVENNHLALLDLNFEGNAFSYSSLQGNINITLEKIDILDYQKVARIAQDVDIVVHMAAMVGVQEIITNSLYTLDVNYIGTSNVLKAISENPQCKRVVVFSTSEIFGSNAFRTSENGDSVLASVEDARWCYCISKMASEHLGFAYYRQRGLPVVVVRPFNVFGPKRVGDHVVLRFILRALSNEDLEVYGDGTQIRAWCYIDDFCNALLQCLEKEEAVGQAFNIGNPLNTVTIYELAKKIVLLCDSKSKILLKKPDFTDIDVRVPNTSKARKTLGYTPQVDLEEGLIRTIEWVKTNIEEISAHVRKEQRTYIPK